MRGPSRARLIVVALGVVLAALASGTALAYFTTTGSGAAAAGVSNLSKPVISAATPAIGGTVTVTWGAVTAPGAGAVTYFVTRDGESAAGTCPTAAAPAAVTTCVDKGVEPGSHSYAVTAIWGPWTTPGPTTLATVAIGAATHFGLSAASTTPVAGATVNLTITAQDSNDAKVTTYTGSKSLTFSGALASPSGTAPTVTNASNAAIAFGTATSITFASGAATRAMRLYRAAPASLSVTDGSLVAAPALAVTVTNAALSKLVLGVEATTPAVGAADDLTVSAQDTYGNPVSSYEGSRSMTFTGASASPNGTVPTVTDSAGEATAFGTAIPIYFEAGIATTSGSVNGEMRLYKSGATSVKVTDGSLTSATVTVTPPPGAATKLVLTASTVTPVAGASVSLTTTAQDIYGNTATTYTGSKSLTFSGALASPSGTAPTVTNASNAAVAFGTATPITFASGVAARTLRIYRAAPASLMVTDGTLSSETALAMTVSNTTLSKFVLAAETTTPVAGAADDLTITAQDTYGNTVLTHVGTKSITFSGASASLGGNTPTVTDSEGNAIAFGTATPLVFEAGVASATGPLNGEMRLYKSAAATVKATEGSISGSLVVTASPATAVKFAMTSSASTLAANATANLTTTAQDTYGNTATAYAGSKALTFSGASASPSGSAPTVVNSAGTAISFGSETAIAFTNGVAAVGSSKNGLLRLFRAGATAITATDGTISTATPVNVTVTATTASKLIFTDLVASAGAIGSPCLFTCTVTGLGNSATVTAGVAVTDTYGNVNSNIGTGHSAAVTVTGGGAITSGTFTFPSTGPAESPADFTYTSQSSGSYTASIKAATTAGTAYTNATATAIK